MIGAGPGLPTGRDCQCRLVLSEVLRDVDLFVGAATQTPRALLQCLIPRLAVADRRALEGRFLHVRGERQTDEIHLGSGNIFMAPDDRYLCIVPGSSPSVPQAGCLILSQL